MAEQSTNYHFGLGRRKEAVATVRLYKGKGGITINDLPAEQYFHNATLETLIRQPLALSGQDNKFNISVRVNGGGKTGQADAIRLGVARALQSMSQDLRPTLKKAGLLTRDSREKERKKYGLKRARKAPQFSKR
jgi:small subunit ribosomal protein S9